MVRHSLKNLLKMFPYFLSKNPSSNFYKSQSVTNKQFQGLYNDLHNVYRSFHLNKRCLIWREQSEPYVYVINFVANYPHLKSVTCYKNEEVIYTESYNYDENQETFDYSYEGSTLNDDENGGSADIIPKDSFKIIVETYDEYIITKGFPENNISQGDIYDHDESLDEIGALHNIPRKEYVLVDEAKYPLTEPPFNNCTTEDDYHYMNRIINYIMLIRTVPLPVAEIWKMYGVLPEMTNRQLYLLKMFDIFLHDYFYDDTVDEQGNYTCPGDRLFVGDWTPREWEHKDTFYDYSYEYGCYFFVNINTNLPSVGQPVKLSFRFLNSFAVEIEDNFLVDIKLNDEIIVSDFNGLFYPPTSSNQVETSNELTDNEEMEGDNSEENNLEETSTKSYRLIENSLNSAEDNLLEITAKKLNGEIIGIEKIVIRVRGCGTADYYVDAINGSDDNDGNMEAPFQSLAHALTSVKGNDKSIVLLEGEYEISNSLLVSSNCTIMGCPEVSDITIINNNNNNFFTVPAKKSLTLKNLNLEAERNVLTIDNAVYDNQNYKLPLSVTVLPNTIEDTILFNPSFTTEDSASVISNGGNGFSSTQNEGVWSFTNARLSSGWINTEKWECDFDLMCTGLRYIGLKILCLLDGTTIFGGWENCIATTPSGAITRDNNDCLGLLHGSIWDNPDTPWVHIHIEKTGPKNISITKTGDTERNGTVNYVWEQLENIPAFTIGAGNNLAGGGTNWSDNKVMIKNLIVKKLSEE